MRIKEPYREATYFICTMMLLRLLF